MLFNLYSLRTDKIIAFATLTLKIEIAFKEVKISNSSFFQSDFFGEIINLNKFESYNKSFTKIL